ncbi:MAG: glycosyltransferase family A protein, partial [Gammaproteobacteria bacterium]
MRTSARIKVSLYIPCHNYGRYLPQAVDSVLGQIMTEWDLVIINDGSSDNTTEIADAYAGKYPEKIRVHHHDKAQGLLRCANVALEMVKGEYIMRLDADDFL